MKNINLSIIIPSHNEANRIENTLKTVRNYLAKVNWKTEVIVVDDGSQDGTTARVTDFMEDWESLLLVKNPKNCGKGFSVKNGILHASGRVVLFTDADLSTPVEEIPKLIEPIIRNESDLTFGSRALDRSLIGVHQSLTREFSGRIFNWLVQMLIGLPFKDTQCGFKAFRHQAIIPFIGQQRISGFGFDPEILFLAKINGLRLQEIPIRWNHHEGTKVRFFQDSLKMFLGLIQIRLNQLFGRYS